MINEKMKLLGSQRSTIRELFEYGKGLKKEIGEENVFDFSLGNPSVQPPARVNDGIIDLISEESPTALHGYTSAEGDLSVRLAVAEHIKAAYGLEADERHVYMTVGAAAALSVSLSALVTTGEEVVVLAPYFPEYKVFIENCGAELRAAVCKDESFTPDIENLRGAITPRCAAVIINSPNNPTGAVYSESDIKAIAELLEEKSVEYGKDIYIISDEPYRELVYSDVSVPFIPNYYKNTVVCYSYSKSLSIPGERIGYVFVSPRICDSDSVFRAVCGAGRALGYVCAPSLLQKLVARCTNLTSDIEIYKQNRDILFDALTEYGYELTPPCGAFYLFVKALCPDAKAFSEKAKLHGLLLVPSDDFGYPGYVRIAYCQSTDTVKRSLKHFKALAEEYGIHGAKKSI